MTPDFVSRPLAALVTLTLMVASLFFGGCATSPSGNAVQSEAAVPRGFDPGQAGAVATPGTNPWSSEPRPQRTGLATAFGERRESTIRPTSFKRRDSSPRAEAAVMYNDRAGLDALMAGMYGPLRMTNAPLQLGWNADFQFGLRGDNENWLPAWVRGRRTFIEGHLGERYDIVLINQARVRREVVVSVDGLDVLDGKPASLRKRGYILDPGQQFVVEGFRTGVDTVAAFRFGTVDDSYSSQRHGTTRNVGVIGIAIFDEKDRESERRTDADPFPGAWATPPRR